MMTESIGECPICEKAAFTRYGSMGVFTFVACPHCLFAYGQDSDTHDESNGIVTGTNLLVIVMDRLGCESIDELQGFMDERVEEIDSIDDPLFEFDEDEEANLINSCIGDEDVVNRAVA